MSFSGATLEAQGYFRVVRPIDNEQKLLSAALLPISIGPELDISVPGQRPGNLIVSIDGKTRAALPSPQPVSTRAEGVSPPVVAALFRRGTTRAILAWNGKPDTEGEELLILSSDWVSATGQDEAVIGIVPLPGKPTSVERVPDEIFQRAKQITDKKIAEIAPPEGQVVPGPMVYPFSADHSVFILAFNNLDHFSGDVNYFTKTVFDPSVQVVIDSKAMDGIKQYWEQGFRYFAFDVPLLGKQVLRKTAVAYRFQSMSAYYPLAVGAIGGTGDGLIDLIVITPGNINLRGAFEQDKEEAAILVKGKTAVDLTMDEVRELDPRLADVFKSSQSDSVRVRNFLIEAKEIGGFKNDFIGVNAEEQRKDPPALDSEGEEPQEQAKEHTDAFERFSLEFYRQLIDDKTKQNQNVVCSPWSAAIALAMLYEGANTGTAAEIQKALQFQGDAKAFEKYLFMIAVNASKDWGIGSPLVLETANAFCMQADYKFHPSYKTLLQERFQAELFAVDFKGNPAEAVKEINQWCAQNTKGKIKEIVSEVSQDSRAVIMNAVYFNARWWEVFDTRNTKPERFRHADGSASSTPMMNMKKADFSYYETKGFKVLAMPYTGNAHMLILLPDKADGLADLEKSLTPAKLRQIDGKLADKLVNVKIPRFKFESTAELIPPLQKMGIKSAFDASEQADFSKITGDEKLYVSNIRQKAIIRVDEKGTEAAAVTEEWATVGMPEDEKVYTFYADHPFLFLIRENTDNSILFMGRVHQPEKVAN